MERYLTERPTLARRPSRLERAWLWCRRRPALASLTAATSLLLAVVLIGSTVTFFRVKEARRAAEHNLYVANMGLVQNAWDQNNDGLVDQPLPFRRLADGWSRPAGTGPRGFGKPTPPRSASL